MARPRTKRHVRPRQRSQVKKGEWMPLAAFAGLMAGFFVAYLGAEMALSARIHPIHWTVAGGGGVLGYLGGMVWYRVRGDII